MPAERTATSKGLPFAPAAIVAALLLAVVVPAVTVLVSGISPDGAQALTATFASASGLQTLGNTLLLGTVAGAVGTALGFAQAYTVTMTRIPGKRILRALAVLPMISPPFALSTAAIGLFGRSGVFTDLTGVDLQIYGLHGLVLVHGLSFAPIAYLNIAVMLRRIDPTLIEAAGDLGASRARVLRTVILPLIVPALLGSFLLVFVESIADLANPLVLGGDYPVLATQIYYAVTGQNSIPTAAGLALALLVPALAVFLLQRRLLRRRTVVTVTGKSGSSARPHPGGLWSGVIATVAIATCLLVIALYAVIFLGGFVTVLGVNNTFTLEHFAFLLKPRAQTSIWQTILMAAVAAPLAVVLGLSIGWLVSRRLRPGPLSSAIDFAGMLGLAVPGTVLGLGFSLAYGHATQIAGTTVFPALAGGNAILGGIVAIVLVYVARGAPNAQQSTIAALGQLSPALEEAATDLGAGPGRRFRTILLPLLAPAISSGLQYAVSRSMTVITAIIFITTPSTRVIAAEILAEVNGGRFGNAFAFCTLLIVLVLVLMGVASLAVALVTRLATATRVTLDRKETRNA